MELGLEGRSVLITGGSQGIGLACAAEYLAAGSRVAVLDLNPRSAADALGPEVLALACDVREPGAIEQAAAAVEDAFGAVDVLVNNVGVAPFRNGFLTVRDEDWQATLAVNVFSLVRAARAVIPGMLERGRGALVNLASDAARQPDPFFVDYAVSKAAVVSLSKSLSIEFGPRGIRSNCVAPGPTRTPAMDDFLDSLGAGLGLDRESAHDHFATVMRKLPLGRLNSPAEVAKIVCLLGSDVTAQVTGATWTVDAGAIVGT